MNPLHAISRPRGAAIGAAAVTACVVLVALLDFGRTGDQVPPVPPLCSASDCVNARNAVLNERLAVARELEADYRQRAWLYAGVVVAALAFATAVSLRKRPRSAWRRIFTNVGTTGVCLAVAAVALMFLGDSGLVERPALPMFAPALAAVAAAAVGGVAVRLGAPEATTRQAAPGAVAGIARTVALGGLVLTGVTLVLAWIYIGSQPGCGGAETEGAPGWTETVATAALVSAGLAAALGVVALAARRWLVALLSFSVNPTALLFMAASSCVFY